MTDSFMAMLQGSQEGFRQVLDDPELLSLRAVSGPWEYGTQLIETAISIFAPESKWRDRVDICLINSPAANATWFKNPDEDSFVIGINAGLVKTLELVSHDVFGYGEEDASAQVRFTNEMIKRAVPRVATRTGAFLELGFPLGISETDESDPRRTMLARALAKEALQFAVFHELAHLLLLHDQGQQHLLHNRFVDLQITTFSIGQEHQADKLAIRLHSGVRQSESKLFPGIEFAGPALLFGVLGLFERYGRYQAAFDSPHAHPPAYERLYRLRIAFSVGDGHQYWSIPEGDGFRLARQLIPASPEALSFADAITAGLLGVLEAIETAEGIPSPVNTILNDFGDRELSRADLDHFCSEVFRWLFLGSPERVLQHLGEAYRRAASDITQATDPADLTFLGNAVQLIKEFASRVREVDCHSVRRAVQRFERTSGLDTTDTSNDGTSASEYP